MKTWFIKTFAVLINYHCQYTANYFERSWLKLTKTIIKNKLVNLVFRVCRTHIVNLHLNPTNFNRSRSVWTSSLVVIEWLVNRRTGYRTPSPWKLIDRQVAGWRQSQFRVRGGIIVVVWADRWETALIFNGNVLLFGFLFEKVCYFDWRRFTMVWTVTGHF